MSITPYIERIVSLSVSMNVSQTLSSHGAKSMVESEFSHKLVMAMFPLHRFFNVKDILYQDSGPHPDAKSSMLPVTALMAN